MVGAAWALSLTYCTSPPGQPWSSRSPPTQGWVEAKAGGGGGLLASYNSFTQPRRVCQLTEWQYPRADRHNLSKIRQGDWTQREAEKHSRSWAEQGLQPLASQGSSICRGLFRATPHSLPPQLQPTLPATSRCFPRAHSEQRNQRTLRLPGSHLHAHISPPRPQIIFMETLPDKTICSCPSCPHPGRHCPACDDPA